MSCATAAVLESLPHNLARAVASLLVFHRNCDRTVARTSDRYSVN
jgi:hypothetical protein